MKHQEIFAPMATNHEGEPSAMEPVAISDPTSLSQKEPINNLQMHINELEFSTPKKNLDIPLADSSFIPQCDENLKPKVGMIFEGLEAVEEFYKSYAHHVGFGVRVGQQKKLENQLVRTKRFMCNREGFKSKAMR